jgi:hypothetical protein
MDENEIMEYGMGRKIKEVKTKVEYLIYICSKSSIYVLVSLHLHDWRMFS